MAFFIKYEFWYFYLKTLQQRKIKHYLIAGVFRPNQLFFKPYAKWYLAAIHGFNHLFLQEAASYQLMKKTGKVEISIDGDPRIDSVLTIAANPSPIPQIKQFKSNKKLFILGSSHTKDLQVFFAFLERIKVTPFFKDWRFLIAPHEIDNASIEQIEHLSPMPIIRFTHKNKIDFAQEITLMILDTIGQLSTAYQYADMVFIGGGFDKSIHNLLEPAVFGLPICFGPKHHHFKEAIDLIELGGAAAIQDAKGLTHWFTSLQATQEREKIGQICKKYTWQNKGATQKIIDYLTSLSS